MTKKYVQKYELTLNFMALMLSVYGTPAKEGGDTREYNDDPDQCLCYLLNGKWKLNEKGECGVAMRPKRQMSIYDFL